jgi:hypothetical protein
MVDEVDPRWAALDRRFGALHEQVCRAMTAKHEAVTSFFRAADEALSSQDPADEIKVFSEVAHLLATRTCDAEVWLWLEKVASEASDHRRQMLQEALLTPIVEPPINRNDLLRLWETLRAPRTRWIVEYAYADYPRRRPVHGKSIIACLTSKIKRTYCLVRSIQRITKT